jgi:DNA-binding transcriptional MerR regulator
MQIGELAKKVGMTVRTIRYYEELGLVNPSSHTSGGFRVYGEESLKRLEVIRRLKGMDLTLPEIRRIFHPQLRGGKNTVGELYEIFNGKLELIEAKTKALGEMKSDIRRTLEILRSCKKCGHGVLLDINGCCDCGSLRHNGNVPEIFKILLEKTNSRTRRLKTQRN